MELPRRSRKKPRKDAGHCIEVLSDDPQPIETIDLTAKKRRTFVENHFPTFPSINGKLNSPEKKDKDISLPDDSLRRSQPHRAARFTDSYVAPVENTVVSDEEQKKNGDCSGSSSSEDSDSDCEIIPLSPMKPLTNEEQAEWENKVQDLQKTLRNEDVKLALLRKLKHSQEMKEEKKETPSNPLPLPPHINLLNKARALKEITITTTTAPLPVSPTKKLMLNSHKRLQRPIQPNLKKSTGSDGPMNLVKKCEKPIITIQPITVDKTSSSSQSRSNIIIPTVKSADSSMKITATNIMPKPNHQEKAIQDKVMKEMTAQHQAVAKLALRKQLEKTLLQIPPPKPTATELHFLPNANTPQFVYYLGLDVVVDFLTKTKRPPFFVVEPFVCSECKTDFTSTWRTIKKSKSSRKQSIICDTCYSVTTKRSLKVDHTSRLKAAFVKALQQEKEIENMTVPNNFSSTSSVTISPSFTVAPETSRPSSSSSVSNKSVSSSSTSQSSRTAAAAASQNFFLGNPALLNLASFSKLTPQQLQAVFQAQAQSFMAAATANLPMPAHMVPLSPFMPPYPFHMSNKSSSTQNDLQRKYLLDMIPPRRQT